MTIHKSDHLHRQIELQTGKESEETVKGWYHYLSEIITRMSPYMRTGLMVTFQQMEEIERQFFETLSQTVKIPDSSRAIFIPGSVLRQMISSHPDARFGSLPAEPTEAGIALAVDEKNHNVIVNCVFALEPNTPAVDVYEKGRFLAGYMYNSIEECIENLSKILTVHLGRS